jgi:Listeria/Bacterioides repeat/Listeria/Bacterioides repeat/Listeria/Bacterioides repeat
MTKKTSKALIIAAVILSLAMVFAACEPTNIDSEVKVTGVSVEFVPTSSVVGSFNVSEVKLTVTNSKGETSTVNGSWDMLTDEDKAKLQTVGTHQVTFTYEGKTASTTIVITATGGGSEPGTETGKTVSVVFNSNGGSGVEAKSALRTVTISSEPVPTKVNKVFAGWYTNRTFSSTRVAFPYTATASITLFAKWADEIVVVGFNGNAGSDIVNNLPEQQEVVKGEKLNSLSNPSRVGYTFGGWFTSDACTGDPVNKATTMFTANATLYAKWTLASYNITFDMNGGRIPDSYALFEGLTDAQPRYDYYPAEMGRYVNIGTTEAPEYVTYSAAYADKQRYNIGAMTDGAGYLVKNASGQYVPYRYNAVFTAAEFGYYVKDGDNYVIYNPLVHTGSVTRYDVEATAAIDGAYAFIAGAQVTTYSVAYQYTTATAACSTPVKAGFEFVGWFADGADTAYTFTTMPAEGFTLYAKWKVADAEAFLSYIVDVDGKLIITGANPAYAKANSATAMTIPYTIDGKAVKGIAANAFKGFTSLVDLKISEGILSVGADAFADSPLTGTVMVAQSVTTVGANAFGSWEFSNNNGFNLKKAKIGATYEYVVLGYTGASTVINFPTPADGAITAIADGAFAGVTITEITIPKTVKTIGANAFKNAVITRERFAFAEDSEISFIDRTAFDGTSYDNVVGQIVFAGTYYYRYNAAAGAVPTEITVPATVKYIGARAFFADALANTTFKFADVTNIETIGDDAFHATQLITMANKGDWVIINGILVKYLGRGGVVEVPASVKAISSKAFYQLGSSTYIKILVFPEVSQPLDIRAYAFYGLKNVNFVFYDDEAPVIDVQAFRVSSAVGSEFISGIGIYVVDTAPYTGNWSYLGNYINKFGVDRVVMNDAVATEYVVGDSLDIDKSKITVYTNDGNVHAGTTAVIADDFATVGATAVPVYEKIDSTLYVKIGDTMVEYDAATHTPALTYYKLSAKNYYVDTREGTYVLIDGSYVLYDATVAAHNGLDRCARVYFKTVEISLSYKSTVKKSVNVECVVKPAIQSIVPSGLVTDYDLGDDFDIDAISLLVTLNDGITNTDYTINAVKYVNVANATVLQLADAGTARYDSTGVADDNGAFIKVYDLAIVGFDSAAVIADADAKLVNVGVTYDFKYNVNPLELTSIRIDPNAVINHKKNGFESAYVVGTTLETLKNTAYITLVYENGYEAYLSCKDADVTISDFDATTATSAQRELTVTYATKEVKMKYDVVNSTSTADFIFAYDEIDKTASITSYTYSGGSKVIYLPRFVEKEGVRYSITSLSSTAFVDAVIEELSVSPVIASIGSGAFRNSNVRVVRFESGSALTTIPDGAFKDATKLTTIDYADNVFTAIGAEAFRNTAFTSFIVPKEITKLGGYAFADNAKLASFGFETESQITDIGVYAFKNCTNTNLSVIVIPDSITKLGEGAFEGTKLMNATIPAKVAAIADRLFFGVTTLTTLTLDGNVTDTGAATIGASAFEGCTALINLSLYDGGNAIAEIGARAFYRCAKLDIAIPTNVSEIGEKAFAETGITTINIPDGVNVGSRAFANCEQATSIVVGNIANDITENLFYGCLRVITLDINPGVNVVGDSAFEGCAALETISSTTQLTTIGSRAFVNCTKLTGIGDTTSLNTVGASAFEGCTSLGTVDIREVTNLGNAAFKNSGLTAVIFSEELIEIPAYAFYGTMLTVLTMPASVRIIGTSAFEICSQLETVTIPVDNMLETIESSAFYSCARLKTLNIGTAIRNAENTAYAAKLSIGERAFENSAITSLYLPSSVQVVGAGAFRGCSQLTTLYVGVVREDSVYKLDNAYKITPLLNSIGDGAFLNDGGLRNFYFAFGATNLPTIGTDAMNQAKLSDAKVHVLNSTAVKEAIVEWCGSKSECTYMDVVDYTL